MILVAATMVSNAFAVTYSDPVGDVAVPGSPFPHMDITMAEVTNTATAITFTFTLNGSPIATNWGKYNVLIHKTGASSIDTATNNNPWGRNFGLLVGSTAFIGSWVNQPSNNSQNWTYNGSWNLGTTTSNTVTSSTVSVTANLSDLGLAVGDTILFDMVTTGSNGGDTAVDSLTGLAVPTDWQQHVDMEGLLYNVNVVPEPGTMAALGLGAMALIRRRRAR